MPITTPNPTTARPTTPRMTTKMSPTPRPTPRSSSVPTHDTRKRLPQVNNEQKKEQINPQKTTLAVTGIADNSGKFFQYP